MDLLSQPVYAGILCSCILFVVYSTYVRIDMYNNPDEFQTPDFTHRMLVSLFAGVICAAFIYYSRCETPTARPNDTNLLHSFDVNNKCGN